MVRRTLCKIIKVALTKELGKNAKLLYKIRWKTLWQQTTVYGTIAKRVPMKPKLDAPLKIKPRTQNPFVIPGIRNLKIESQLSIIIVLIS
jgi:chromosomal replication initiator protein